MRILNVIQCAELGGMEKASLRLMTALASLGHSSHVLSLNYLGSLAPLLKENGISAEGLGYRGPGGALSFLPLYRRLRDIGGRFDALLLTGHNLLAMHALGRIASGNRVLAVHYYHTGVKRDWMWRYIYRIACRKFDAIVFPSRFIRDEAVTLSPEVAAVAQVIRNPLELPPAITPEQRSAARSRLGVPTACPLIGNAGWLVPGKRWDVFFHVAREVRRRGMDAKFLVAGDGPESGRLRELAYRLGLSEHVIWLGWREDLTDFYAALDLLLFHSEWDAFPTTPQEAMAFGIPVVASVRHGGLQEVFEQIQAGTLLHEHDVPQLASSVSAILSDAALAQRLGRAGREGVGRFCCPQSIARQYESCFEAARRGTTQPGRKCSEGSEHFDGQPLGSAAA